MRVFSLKVNQWAVKRQTLTLLRHSQFSCSKYRDITVSIKDHARFRTRVVLLQLTRILIPTGHFHDFLQFAVQFLIFIYLQNVVVVAGDLLQLS